MKHSFWKRWSKEYVNHLQQLRKWKKSQPNLQPGTIVVVKNELLSPAQWRMGRIVQTYPSQDGQVRAVSGKTSSGVIDRPIVKLIPLPVADE